MKKLMALMMGVVCAFGLTACGEKVQEAPQEQKFETALVEAVVQVGAFSEELEELDADTAFMLYKLADFGLVREDLTEAAVLTSMGGIIGVISGIGLAQLISAMMQIPVAIDATAILVSVVFSTLIGVVFGLLPATQAANLNPIQALRRD